MLTPKDYSAKYYEAKAIDEDAFNTFNAISPYLDVVNASEKELASKIPQLETAGTKNVEEVKQLRSLN